MSRYEVDSAQVTATAAAVQSRATTIRSEVAAMQRQLVALQDTWRGSAATQFAAVMHEWSTASARLDHALGRIGDAMQAAGRTYADAEAQAARMFTPS
ncbi:WXG100 family type VII secretion target [Cellulomonas edaphi]|uniref:ESAT-6-like protein n=1 Tax=Cellulomonas edaphi TaxID=3053468 RepID=A0ABT7S6B6_9CELL|nr:WXG100 family type VII secretion target [Cellulomons edaphi]MDM7830509.1 WXG100 family type VII secretion target [Cellulomons edaphi]